MIVFSNAKINLGLYVTKKRTDGFHNIETLFYPVDWCDVLEINKSEDFRFESANIPIPGDIDSNLCVKAYDLLKKDFDLSPVHIHLLKNIPIGAGLGGGSSNAAFTLTALNGLFELGLSNEVLENYAKQLGSDCAFFIENQPTLAYEKGDVFEKVDSSLPFIQNLKKHSIVLVYPAKHIGTAWAYGQLTPQKPKSSIKDYLDKPLEKWRNAVNNDFEMGVYTTYPEIEAIKNRLYDVGAVFALLSGSGSTVYGIFEENFDLDEICKEFLEKGFVVRCCRL